MDSLLREIWTKTFSYIPLYKDLIQCQLACRRWNYPAETAMLRRNIDVSSERQLIQVCNHLDKDPARGKLVPSLRVYFRSHQPSIHVERLSRLAFNPNARHIFGTTL